MNSKIYLKNIGNIGKIETTDNRAIFHRLDNGDEIVCDSEKMYLNTVEKNGIMEISDNR